MLIRVLCCLLLVTLSQGKPTKQGVEAQDKTTQQSLPKKEEDKPISGAGKSGSSENGNEKRRFGLGIVYQLQQKHGKYQGQGYIPGASNFRNFFGSGKRDVLNTARISQDGEEGDGKDKRGFGIAFGHQLHNKGHGQSRWNIPPGFRHLFGSGKRDVPNTEGISQDDVEEGDGKDKRGFGIAFGHQLHNQGHGQSRWNIPGFSGFSKFFG